MTHKDFTIWLKGFLAGKNYIDSDELVLLNKELDNVVDEPRVTRYPITDPTPRKDITYPHPFERDNPYKPPFINPTCETAKKLFRGEF